MDELKGCSDKIGQIQVPLGALIREGIDKIRDGCINIPIIPNNTIPIPTIILEFFFKLITII